MIENECDYWSQFQLPVYYSVFQYKGYERDSQTSLNGAF